MFDWFTDWLKETLIESIMANLGGLFEAVSEQVGDIAAQVGSTPGDFNPGVFSMIREISEVVVLPIAGLVLTFVAAWELIGMLIEKNNLHDVDSWMFFRWIMKTMVAIMILSNTWNIVMAVFDVAQSVVRDASGLIGSTTGVTVDMLTALEADLQTRDNGYLLGLWMQASVVGLTMKALNIAIFVVVWGRMIEIYMRASLAPIPLATLSNREYGQMGQNYIKTLLAVGLQGVLIMVCVAIYAVLVGGIAVSADPMGAIWSCVGYTVLLCFALFKSGGLANSVMGAH